MQVALSSNYRFCIRNYPKNQKNPSQIRVSLGFLFLEKV